MRAHDYWGAGVVAIALHGIALVGGILPAHAQEKLVDFDYWASLCQTLRVSADYEGALAACDQAVGLFPEDPEAWKEN